MRTTSGGVLAATRFYRRFLNFGVCRVDVGRQKLLYIFYGTTDAGESSMQKDWAFNQNRVGRAEINQGIVVEARKGYVLRC